MSKAKIEIGEKITVTTMRGRGNQIISRLADERVVVFALFKHGINSSKLNY